jgi:tetratricopeptide (TPR) repeat protein
MRSKVVALFFFSILFQSLQAADSDDRAQKYLSRASELVQQRKYAEAVAECDRIVRWKSNFAEAYYTRGVANAYLRRSDAALRDFTVAIRYKPEYPAALEGRAALFRASAKLEEALLDYNSLIRLVPNDARLLRLRAYLQLDLKHDDLALKDLDEAIRMAPQSADAQLDRTRIAERLTIRPIPKAVLAELQVAQETGGRSIAPEPPIAPMPVNRPVMLHAPAVAPIAPPQSPVEQEKPVVQEKPPVAPEQSVQQQKPLVQEKPAVPEKPVLQEKPVVIQQQPVVQQQPVLQEKWMDALAAGLAFEAKRDFANAIAAFTKSTEIKDENPEAHYHLGTIYAGQGQSVLALYQLTLAIRYRAGYADALKARAQVKRSLGDEAGAISDLQLASPAAKNTSPKN